GTPANLGQPFMFLQAGFTQAIYGGLLVNPGGVAFAPNADPLVAGCVDVGGAPLHRFGLPTFMRNGTTLHTGITLPSNAGCGLTNHPNGNLYSSLNTVSGVAELDANTGAPIRTMGPRSKADAITVDLQT